jgi:hypothetical protein
MAWPPYTDEDNEAFERAKELGFNQYEKLGLKPWHYPANFINPNEIADILAAGPAPNDAQQKFQAATLAKRLLDAGLSLYEPDCERALNDAAYRAKIKARVRQRKESRALNVVTNDVGP